MCAHAPHPRSVFATDRRRAAPRVALVVVALALLWCRPSWAQSDPVDFVRQTSERLLAASAAQASEKQAQPGRLYQIIEEIVLPRVDFDRMSLWVLGRYWRDASPEQRRRFGSEFARLLVRTYAAAVRELSGVEVRYLPTRQGASEDDVIVRTQVSGGGRSPFRIDYRVRRGSGVWKVYDISVEGVSLIASYRKSFRDEVRKGGLDRLIEELEARNRSASEDSSARPPA